MSSNKPSGSRGSARLSLVNQQSDYEPLLAGEYSVSITPSSQTSLGAEVRAVKPPPHASKARIGIGGGVLIWQGRYFLTTAGRIFDATIPSIADDIDISTDFEYDIEGLDLDDEDTDTESSPVEVPTQASSTTADMNASVSTSGNAPNNKVTEPQAQHPGASSTDTPPQPLLLKAQFATSAASQHPYLNWALLELNQDQLPILYRHHKNNEYIGATTTTSHNEVDEADILIYTKRKPPSKGKLLPTPTFIEHANRLGRQKLRQVHCHDALEDGVGGAWVVTVRERRMVGHIVAASEESGLVYVVPFQQVRESLREMFEGEWEIYMP